MSGTKLMTAAVLLLLCWNTHQASAQFAVSINVDYTPPPGFTPGPNEYRAASGRVIVTCTATGGPGSGDYNYVWTSTCSGCDFITSSSGATSVINRQTVHSGDIGTHTCTATKGEESASDSIVFNVVGAGIHFSSGSPPTGSQPNNGLARPLDTTAANSRRMRFFCRSDSTMPGVGDLLGLDGAAITNSSVFDISNSKRGEVDVNNRVGSQANLTADEQGVYTCRIPLQPSGEMREINIGVYPFGFTSRPTIINPLEFTPGSSSSTLTCISTGSVATTVTFRRGGTTVGVVRDGDSVPDNGVTYQLTQTLNNRRESTYQNVLTITGPLSSLGGSSFTCQVGNVLGMSVTSQAFVIPAVLTVVITVDYTPPPGFTPGPNEYRAASGRVIVTCTASGGAGSGAYQYVWTSTCESCAFQTSSTGATSVINRQAVHSGDIGTHTCTATRGGESASDSIVFNVVGAGINVFNGAGGTTGTQPNNSLVVSNDVTSGRRFQFVCRSDSLALNVGTLIGLDGTTFSGNNFLVIETPANGGELCVRSTAPSQQPLPDSEQGIYTCQIPLQSGEMVMVNIGIYPIGFNTGPTINDPPVFTPGSPSHTLTCTSTGSPATSVTFMRDGTTVGPLRDGEAVSVGGITYQLAQRVDSRQASTYENVLTFSDDLNNLVNDVFTCTVDNTLGMDTSPPLTITAIVISSSSQTVTVGDTVTYTCTSVIGPATIEWQDVNDGGTTLRMASGVTELALVLGPVSQSMNGRMYRCRVTVGGTSMSTVTLEIEAPSVTARIGVSGSRALGEDITLTCDVTGLSSLASDTAIEFSGPREAMGTGTSLQLTLNPAEISDAGQYTCVATVSSSLLNSDVEGTDTEDLRLQIPDPSVSVTHDGGTPLYAGIVLTLTCEITVNGIQTGMLSNVVVSTTWIGAGGNTLVPSDRISITDAMQNSGTNSYISTVEIDILITGSMGTYTCQANIDPSGSLTFIDASNAVDDITLEIQLPTLALSAVSSTTRLPNVAPYNTFNLTCTAIAPEGVVAPKTFTWRRTELAGGTCAGFAVVSDNIDNNNLVQPVSTSVLTVTETDAATRRFCCQASVAGADGSPNDELPVEVVGPAPPTMPTNLRFSSPGATTVTVQWTVPLIAYTPETYVVSYSTGTLTRQQPLMSDPVGSGTDFDAVDQTFSVELTGLEPNTAYNYQVISENTEGTTASVLQGLTTTAEDPNDVTIVGGVLGALVGLLLAYGVVTTIVIAVLMHRIRRGRVSINQPVYAGTEQPVKWSAMTRVGDPDIKTSECVAYGQAQPPSTEGAQDTTYEVI